MSIINYKKGRESDASYLANNKVNYDEMVGRKYDNLVDSFVRKNLTESFCINVDMFIETYLDILKGLMEYDKTNKKLNSTVERKNIAAGELKEKEQTLRDVNNQEKSLVMAYNNRIKVMNDGVIGTVPELGELYSAMDEKKKAIECVEATRAYISNVNNQIFELRNRINEIKEDLIHSYNLIISLFKEVDINKMNNFDETTEEDVINNLPYGIYQDKEFFYKELYNGIIYEILLVSDLLVDIDSISFNQLDEEQLDKINKTYFKYSRIKRALDIKYEVLRNSFIDSYNKNLDNRKARRNHLDNVHAYKRILTHLNRYIDIVYADETNTLSEDTLEAIEQSLGSLFSTNGVEQSTKSVSELYVKDCLINAEEFNYLSNITLR